jgi:hypothetical protein
VGLRYFCFAFLLLSGYFSFAQLLPEQNARLNYTQIMFEHPALSKAHGYIIEVALDEPGHTFQNPVARQKSASTATIISNFEFGKSYVWRYAGLYNGKEPQWHGPYTFNILNDTHVDHSSYRVRIVTNDSLENSGGLITLDNERVIVDRAGNFVWFLPADSIARKLAAKQRLPDNQVNDLQVTPTGTITVLNHYRAQELNLNGKAIWTAPKKSGMDSSILNINPAYLYNHGLKKLSTGNYMVIDGM